MYFLSAAVKPEYILIIGASLIIIISFVFNFISKKTNIPSVLMLMVLGVAIQFMAPDVVDNPLISQSLIVIGKVGLILIVLEAALDLKLSREKIGLIIRSFLVALLALGFSSILIAFSIQGFLGASFYKSIVYAVPLSIMSSAIIIPSVSSLSTEKKEFMIYESTFSDILGIIFFQFLTAPNDFETTQDVIVGVGSNIGITILVAVLFSYIAVWVFNKLTSHVKLFLIISVLTLMYGIGSVYHLSSLIIILFFGIILNNVEVFFRGPLKKLIDKEKLKPVFHEFHIVTLESAFFLRTFFFVMFGITISLATLVDIRVAIQSIVFIGILYLVRFIVLKLIMWNKDITPQLWIAPRGLITVLLFYTIPFKYDIPEFYQGVLLYAILVTSLIMTFALIKAKGKKISDVMIKDLNLNYLEDGMEKEMAEDIKEYHEAELGKDSNKNYSITNLEEE
ncbi:MAG: cation:proton antiporter [Flavobacteriales bacterium]